jgi:hypothetical protein
MNNATERCTRIAFHEAGHAASAVLLRTQPGPVTIVPSPTRGGCSIHSWDKPAEVNDIDAWFDQPMILWPIGVRQMIETNAMIAMAGRIAESLTPSTDAPRDPHAFERHAYPDHPWPGPSGLTAAEEHDLAEAAADSPEDVISDAELAAQQGWLLFGSTERRAWRHARWLRAEVETLLHANRAKVERVARALQQHRTLSGADVRRLIAGD